MKCEVPHVLYGILGILLCICVVKNDGREEEREEEATCTIGDGSCS